MIILDAHLCSNINASTTAETGWKSQRKDVGALVGPPPSDGGQSLSTTILKRRDAAAGNVYSIGLIEGFYNTHRSHSALGYVSLADFEEVHRAA